MLKSSYRQCNDKKKFRFLNWNSLKWINNNRYLFNDLTISSAIDSDEKWIFIRVTNNIEKFMLICMRNQPSARFNWTHRKILQKLNKKEQQQQQYVFKCFIQGFHRFFFLSQSHKVCCISFSERIMQQPLCDHPQNIYPKFK